MAATTPAVRSFLQVGMWTLGHDREAVLSPVDSAHAFTLQACATCARRPVTQAAMVRADGDSVTLLVGGKTERVRQVETGGRIAFAADGEQVALNHPVTVTARGGELTFAVRLPVESYVERVVASESGPQDSIESLKALAIVVRTYALHENHGHTEYDLCDSTHCELLHWGGAAQARSPSRAYGNAGHGGGDAVVSWTASAGLLSQGLRRPHRLSSCRSGRGRSPWPILTSHADRYCTAHGGRELEL